MGETPANCWASEHLIRVSLPQSTGDEDEMDVYSEWSKTLILALKQALLEAAWIKIAAIA
ncbi:MAG: hypothetical protein O7G85_07210 [Planctomycetota bacterium]|nr:hypothetical protein [Planctomycetota bacterium]